MTVKVINKWNNEIYSAELQGDKVKISRQDGTEFIISMKEFRFNYKEYKPK